jgi:carbamoyltransferase
VYILGINRSKHDGSVALLKDNDVIFYIESERLSNIKHDDAVFKAIGLIEQYTDHLDYIVLSGVSNTYRPYDSYKVTDAYEACVLGLNKTFSNPRPIVFDFSDNHHSIHAATAFYNSGFNEALCIVKDGAGSEIFFDPEEMSVETSSSIIMSYPNIINNVEKHFTTSNQFDFDRIYVDRNIFLTNTLSEATAFEFVAEKIGLSKWDAGKVMGLSAYGKEDSRIPTLYTNDLLNKDIFPSITEDRSMSKINIELGDTFEDKANLSYKIQKEVQENVAKYILKMLKETEQKNLCLSGGLFLNCVSNYNLLKQLPPDINIYVEPMSTDAGNAIGAAKYAYYSLTKSKEIKKQTSIYYGPTYKYTKEDLNNEKIVENVSPKDVAKLISEKNIVALYQGRSEGGPRALGNRSILYDPRDPNGKDHVNIVKKREWYRPFAGTVLYENAKEWFDLQSLDESKFMMFAVDVIEDKKSFIPAITHVDGTCRVQTLKREDNLNYYNLIEEFYKITGVPILFNTSLNLAGDAINETLKDALKTLHNSEIKYLYLPELNILVTK